MHRYLTVNSVGLKSTGRWNTEALGQSFVVLLPSRGRSRRVENKNVTKKSGSGKVAYNSHPLDEKTKAQKFGI